MAIIFPEERMNGRVIRTGLKWIEILLEMTAAFSRKDH